MRNWIIVLIASACLAGCAGPQLLNMAAHVPGKVEHNISYGPLTRQKLDIYNPKTLLPDTPVLVFYHGGSWQFGSKEDYKFFGTSFAASGVQTIIVNYRLYPEVGFPGFVEDGAKALAFIQQSIAKDRPIFIAGHSAGAHIAALIDLDPRYLAAEGTNTCAGVKGLIGIAGPYFFTPIEPVYKEIFPATTLDISMPLQFAATRAPPALFLHGTDDTIVEPKLSEEMAQALIQHGNSAELKLYQGVGHNFILGAISPLLRQTAPTLRDTLDFMRAQKAQGYPGCARKEKSDAPL
ncbi:alpha/beta hydrolase [Candidatus Phycosocius spiralis]|uniref:Esterase n=1 Tax=Candidatus Phycosocius spiralis TaxID=2815099 RepID=A0ABQ4PX25_9PROT|nr:alpha/beta hydrolase [Candidatus Phycosocius spiralis]GIU67582.1 esterase [Candidatus Phycosocius spiralis]